MRVLIRFALLAGMTGCLGAQAELVNFQEAIEASDLRVSVMSSGKGYVNARSCSTCKFKRLKITLATVISIDGERVPAGKIKGQHWPGGLVIYDVKTKHAVKLEL